MSIYQLLQDFDVVRSMVIDSEVDIIRSALQLSAAALTADPLQLAAELIGRLLPMKGNLIRIRWKYLSTRFYHNMLSDEYGRKYQPYIILNMF